MTSATERASLLLEGAVRRKESIVSPEGVPMSVEVASYGDRLAAFILDSLFWTVAAVAPVRGGPPVQRHGAGPQGGPVPRPSSRPFSCATST